MKNRLRVLRAEFGLTQAELARRLDVSRQTIIAIEKGRFDPSLSLAFKISDAFSAPVEEIFIRTKSALKDEAADTMKQTVEP